MLPIFGKVKCRAGVANLTAESRAMLDDFYAQDIRLHRLARLRYQRALSSAEQNPQVPDCCPDAQKCSLRCPHRGCKVPYLDEPFQYPCVTAGCNPQHGKLP